MAFREEGSIRAVAEIVQAILNLHDSSQGETRTRSWCKAVLPFALRQIECFVDPEVSVLAQGKAASLGVANLGQKRYGFQEVELVEGELRPLFLWEHVVPVKCLQEKLLSLPKPRTVDAIEAVLRQAEIAWVLRSEDDRLTELGYRTKRPTDPWQAYRDAEIRIVGKPW